MSWKFFREISAVASVDTVQHERCPIVGSLGVKPLGRPGLPLPCPWRDGLAFQIPGCPETNRPWPARHEMNFEAGRPRLPMSCPCRDGPAFQLRGSPEIHCSRPARHGLKPEAKYTLSLSGRPCISASGLSRRDEANVASGFSPWLALTGLSFHNRTKTKTVHGQQRQGVSKP